MKSGVTSQKWEMKVKAGCESNSMKSEQRPSYRKHCVIEVDVFSGRHKSQEYVLYLTHKVLKCKESCS